MKKTIAFTACLFMLLAVPALADKPTVVNSNGVELSWSKTGCTTIQSGLITDSAGNVITTRYDEYGYNYQSHMFNGTYDSVDRKLDGKYYGSIGDYVDDRLSMKWSDEWIANVDCNGDGKLDRGLENGVVSGISKGWTTNHVEGEYTAADGTDQHYTYFLKIGWVGPGGSLWGQYEILQENYQDPTGMMHDKYATPGLGLNDGWTTN